MSSSGDLADLIPPLTASTLAQSWLREDCPSFDPAGHIVGTHPTNATLYLKSSAVLAGRPFFDAVFNELNCTAHWEQAAHEGQFYDVKPNEKLKLASVTGPARNVLLGERVALNALAECSAVATAAYRAVQVAKSKGWKGRVAGTRKTTPGFRLVQKYGMVVGGMDMHRVDLSGMVMLKDNHIRVAGGITAAVKRVKDVAGFTVKVDVECDSVADALEAADAGADVVMLDNFGSEVCKAAQEVKQSFPNVIVEASGGVTIETIEQFIDEAVDVISFSVNRHSKAVDLSLKVESTEGDS